MRNWSHLLLATLLTACGGGGDQPSPQSAAVAPKTCANTQNLIVPIEGTVNDDWFITNYLDTNPVEGQISDYRGGFFSYDQHQGTDFALHDFDQMDEGVAVLAAKCGTVTALHDGEPDRNTEHNNLQWNYVEITHPDGGQTVYGHLRRDSIIVEVGQQIDGGVKIGEVGSSGNSTGPHLHFELIDANNQMLDPYAEGYLSDTYVYEPVLLDSGITTSSDPALDTNFFFETPAAMETVFASEQGVVWLKVVGLKTTDVLAIRGLAPSGSNVALGSLVTLKDYKSSYWYWDVGTFAKGTHTVDILVNNVVVATHQLDSI